MSAKPFAFVLMPFSPAFDDIYKLGIQAVAAEQGVEALRVDEQRFSESMLDRIYRQIDIADFIIADMTGRNPNVFYEVGYAHAKGKLCTLLTQSVDDIPFDLQHHRHIVYSGSIQTLKAMLSEEIQWLKSEREKQKTRPITVEMPKVVGDLEKTQWSATAIVDFKFDLHNKTTKKSPTIETIYLHTGDGWKFFQGSEECPSAPSTQGAKLRHFVKVPTARLPPDGWAQVSLTGRKTVWSKFTGDEPKDKYNLTGFVMFEIGTSEENYLDNLDVSVEVSDVPF